MSISKYNNEGYPDPTAFGALSSIENESRALRAFRPIVYICSPFAGDIEKNVVAARAYSRFAVEQGYIPIAPHLLFPQFLNDNDPKERELGLFFGNAIMSKCSEVWVFGGHISPGMEAEIKRANIASVIRASQVTSVENIDEKLMALQQELIQKAQSKEAYDEIADEIFKLRELRQQTTIDTAARDEQIKRINDLQDYIAQQTTHLTEFEESLVRRWIKQITIWDDHITVEMKSGVSIDVDV